MRRNYTPRRHGLHSLALTQASGLARSAAPPLPTKQCFAGAPECEIALSEGICASNYGRKRIQMNRCAFAMMAAHRFINKGPRPLRRFAAIPFERETTDYDYESGNSYDPVDYVREDSCGNEPPFLDMEDIQHEYNPFSASIKKKIGNTIYAVNISCQGKEPILDKMKRLLLDDSLSVEPQKEGEI